MNKYLWICLVIITLTTFAFAGCGKDPYRNMKLVVEQESIEIVLDHSEENDDSETPNGDESGDEGSAEDNDAEALPKNTAYLDAKIENKNKKQSKRVVFDIVDKSIATLVVTEKDGGYRATITGKTAGETTITVMSLEGNKKKEIPLKVVEPITGLAFDPDFTLAVAVNESYQFSNSSLNFMPVLTNQKDVSYALSEQVQGVSITPTGLLTATEKPTGGYVTVVATSLSNPQLTTSTQVYIYNAIDANKIAILDKNQQPIDGVLQVGKNTKFNNVPVNISIEDTTENFIAYAEVSDSAILSVQRSNQDMRSFIVTGIEQSKATIKFKVGIEGIKQQQFVEKTLEVEILDLIDTIYVNGSSKNSVITVFDTYANTTETAFGTRVLIEVAPINASNKKITFKADETSAENLAKLDFFTTSGQAIPNILSYELTNNSVIYVKPKTDVDFAEFACKLTIVGNSGFDEEAQVYNELTINVKNGIKNMSFVEEDKFIELSNADYQEFQYIVNNAVVTDANIATLLAGFDLTEIRVLIQKSNILSAKIENSKLYIKPLASGTTTLTLRSTNGISSAPATIRVVVPTDDANVDIDRNAYKEHIASIERNEDNILTKINANIYSTIALYVNKTQVNGTIWNLTYTSSNTSVATITNNGTIRALSQGTTKITATYEYAVKDALSGVITKTEKTQEIELFIFKPIKEFNIGKESASTFDVNTIGYYDASLYSTIDFSVQMNDAYIQKRAIRMYLRGEAFDIENSLDTYKIVGQGGILFYHGNGKATFLANIAIQDFTPQVGIVAEVREFDRVYRSICIVDINKATQVSEIVVYNANTTIVDGETYYSLDFRAGAGLGETTDNKKQISVKTQPSNAVNGEVFYFAYDHLLNNQISPTTKASEIIKVSQDGVVTPLKAGDAKIVIVPRDQLTRYDLNKDGVMSMNELLLNLQQLQLENSKLKYKEIIVHIADGSIENPYYITNAVDFLNIATGLNAHYILTQTIDLSKVNLYILGSSEQPFTGSINGRYYVDKANDKFVDSKILGVKLAKTFEDAEAVNNFALFGVVKGSRDGDYGNLISSFQNLTIEFDSYNIEVLGNYSDSTTFNLGYLTAEFKGQMQNVSIVVRNKGSIKNQSQAKVNFGAISAQVYEYDYLNAENEVLKKATTLENVKVIGGGTIEIDSLESESYIGGMVGILNENTSLDGNYSFANDIINQDSFVFSFNGQENDLLFNVVIAMAETPLQMAVGGVVGKNIGTIKNISAYANVLVITTLEENATPNASGKNIGGIVGLNNGTMTDIFSRCAVVGHTNVGGIAGCNTSSISSAVFESYEDGSSSVNGYLNVGGVVGYSQGGALDFCSSTSFISSESKYAVIGYANVGGLVGQAISNVSIIRSYASTKIGVFSNSNLTDKYAGGLVGLIQSSSIKNSYSISNLYKLDETSAFTLGGFLGRTLSGVVIENTYSVSNIENYVGNINTAPTNSNSYYQNNVSATNGGAQSKTSEQLKQETTFASWDLLGTFALNSQVNQGYPCLKYSNNQEFITVVPTKLEISVKDTIDNQHIKVSENQVVLFNQQENIDNAPNYEIALSDIMNLVVEPATNRIIRVKATLVSGFDVIKVDGGNLVILKNGYAKLKISSQLNESAFDYLELYVVNGVNSFENSVEEASILLGDSKELHYIFENGSNKVGNMFGIAYSGFEDYLTFNYGVTEELDGENYIFVDYNYAKILTTLKVVENQKINEIAYINADFDGTKIKVLVPWTNSEFTLTIYNGATDLNLDKDNASITPNQKVNVVATITTDLKTEMVDTLQVLRNGQVVQTFTLTYEDEINSIDDITITSNGEELFSLTLKLFDYDSSNNKLTMSFDLKPLTNLEKISEREVYVLNLKVLDKLEKDYTLTIIPQPIERITVLHFSDGNLNEDEVATDKISSGIEGLLKINVYPSFSQVDYIDIVSQAVNGERITFVQKILSNGSLERMYPDAELITNGIRLNLASIRTDNGYAFDGYLYVSTLIRSDMAENLPFVINLTAYKNDSPIYTYEKTLYTQFSPKVKIEYNGNYNLKFARGTTINVPISLRTMAGTLTASVEGIEDKTLVTFNVNRTEFNGRFVGQISAQIASSIDLIAGTQFTLKLQLVTVVDNIRMYVTDEITLTVVDYIILGVTIDTAYVQSSNNILDVELNIAKTLQAKVLALYATRPDSVSLNSTEAEKYTAISDKITAFERLISCQNGAGGKKQVWFTNENSFLSSKGTTNYYGYTYSNKEGGYYAIYGTRVSAVDKISLNISFYYYGSEGNYGPKLIDKAIDSTTGLEIIDKTITCIVNVKNTTTEEVPLPIYTQAEFEAMQEGVHYILMRDLDLENYKPMEAKFASLDGNGYLINLKETFTLDETTTSMNVGLFASVSSKTLIKNVVLNINDALDNTLDLEEAQSVNFGWFAGLNQGIITNCDVVNIIELGKNTDFGVETEGSKDNDTILIKTTQLIDSNYTNSYIGLFVGQNAGYITNSRVGRDSDNIGTRKSTTLGSGKADAWVGGYIDLVANGIVGGFVGLNTNSISSSFVKNISINNNSVIANLSSTAGFVALNSGTISGSFAEGRTIEALDYANLKSQGSVAGFVNTNDGAIANSYGKFVIRSPSNSAGFVNQNNRNGLIQYSYTASVVLLADGEVDDNASFRPFTGVDDFNEIQNQGRIEYSYYLKNQTTVIFADEPAIAINKENQSKISEYVGFAFVENKTMQNQGIWNLDGYTLPYLNSANQVAVSQRELANIVDADSQEDVMDKPMIYSYVIGYEIGTELNPYIIDTAVKFNNIIEQNTQNGVFGTNIVNIKDIVEGEQPTTKYMRLVNDLNFAETSATATGLYSSKVTFSSVLEGNNMLMSGITLTGEKSAEANQVEFGLFERLDGALIKNLRMQFNSVSATEIPFVGGLAGSAVDSILVGIKIESSGSFVQGKNVVGGLIGLVLGNCELQTIESDINTRATYRKGSNEIYYNDLSFVIDSLDLTQNGELSIETVEHNVKVIYAGTSYAGGLIGAVHYVDTNEQVMRTLKVSGNVSLGAERTGGIIAVNYGKLYDLYFQIGSATSKQELSGDDTVGGLVGVNFGRIEKGRVTYEGSDLELVDSLQIGISGGKTNLFIGSSNYIGGLVGTNIDGEIIDSYSRVNVVNQSANYAGGLVGRNLGGAFDSVYTTGNVQSKEAFGGMFGYMDKLVVTFEENGKTKEQTKLINKFNNVILLNNFTISTAQAVSRGASGGALAGFANVANIGELFEFVGASGTNYAVYNLPLNTALTSSVPLNFFGQAQFDKMEINQEEYNERLNNLNNMTAIIDEVPTKYGWFSTKVDNFANANYQTLFKERSIIFDSYSTENWTKEISTFPLLKITAQSSEIIINEDNRDELLTYLKELPNATYIIKTDISLFSTANRGHLKDDWTSLGTEAMPFSGKFQGEEIEVNGERRYPILNVNKPFINYGASASVTNLTFNAVSSFTGNIDQAYVYDDFYYGVVANYVENSSLSNLKVTNSAYEENYGIGINISYNRAIDETISTPINYIGGAVGYSYGGSISSVESTLPMNLDLQTSANSATGLESYVGGVIGYALSTKIADVKYGIMYDSFIDGNAYYPFVVQTSNGVIGTAIGSAKSTEVTNVKVEQVQGKVNNDELMSTLSSKQPISITNFTSQLNSIANLTFGGVVGKINSSNARDLENNISAMNIAFNSGYEKNVSIGGVVGTAFSTTFTSIVNKSNISFVNSNTNIDKNINTLVIGGLVGQMQGETQVTGQNSGEIAVDLKTATQTVGYVGGLVGESALSDKVVRVEKSRNTANIVVKGLYQANVGGLIGRSALNSPTSGNQSTTRIIQSYNDGNISVVGTLASDNQGREYTLANIEYIGGFIGYANRVNISNCYATGRVQSNTAKITLPANQIGLSAGGFIGRLEKVNVDPEIINCYAVVVTKTSGDAINNNVNCKEFIGSTSLPLGNSPLFATCYYAKGFAENNANNDGLNTPKTHDITANAVVYYDLIKKTTFKGYDFNQTWAVENANTLPLLTWAKDSMAKKVQGSVYKPNLISSSEELLAFAQKVENERNTYYILTNNIVLTSNQSRNNFDGVFDASGFTIYNQSNALFNVLNENAVVSNLNVEFSNAITITTQGNFGVIANQNFGIINYATSNGTLNFESSIFGTTQDKTDIGGIVGENYGYIGFTSSNVTITQTDANNQAKLINIGGIAGFMKNTDSKFAEIANSFASGTLTLHQNTGENASLIGGLVGYFDSGNLRECYVNGRIDYKNSKSVAGYGAVFGGDILNTAFKDANGNAYASIANVYNDYLATLVRSKQNTGSCIVSETTLLNMLNGIPSGFDTNIWSSFSVDREASSTTTMLNYGYPYLKHASTSVSYIQNKGNGSAKNPYLIKNQSGFDLINYLVSKDSTSKYTYSLDNDIYCYQEESNLTLSYVDILSGTLNGNNKTIYNMNSTINNTNFGFINEIKKDSKLEELTFENASITFANNFTGNTSTELGVGAIVGTNNGNISNVSVNNLSVTFANYNGGTSGASESVLSIGGLVGINKGDITATAINGANFVMSNSSTASKYVNLGGFVGKLESGTIGATNTPLTDELGNATNCYIDSVNIRTNSNSGVLTSVYRNIGGFVGLRAKGASQLLNCSVTGSGLTNESVTSVINVVANDPSNNANIGGLIGLNEDNQGVNYSARYVSATTHIIVSANTNSANVYVGGIVGYTNGIMDTIKVYAYLDLSGATEKITSKTTGNALATNVFTNVTYLGE